MSNIFSVSNVKEEFGKIVTFMNDIFVTLQKGNINRVILIDDSIHKSLKEIKRNYNCLTYETSQIAILTFALEGLQHITEIFTSYFNFIDQYFDNTPFFLKVKNRDIFEYCDSASQQITNYINNFHYERMKVLCSY